MIHEPSIDKLAEITGSKYTLCVVSAKRARQLIDSAQNQGLTELEGNVKPITKAAEEIYEGKISVAKF